MTVKAHDALMRGQATDLMRYHDSVLAMYRERVNGLESDRDHWRALAQKCSGDLMEIHARMVPMPPPEYVPETGTVEDGDAEHTPTAKRARKNAQ